MSGPIYPRFLPEARAEEQNFLIYLEETIETYNNEVLQLRGAGKLTQADELDYRAERLTRLYNDLKSGRITEDEARSKWNHLLQKAATGLI